MLPLSDRRAGSTNMGMDVFEFLPVEPDKRCIDEFVTSITSDTLLM